MSPFEQAFPGFIKACADLHATLLPWGFALLVVSFAFKFWQQPVSAPDVVRFLIKLFVIVLLMANAHRLINDDQALVARWTLINLPARPDQVHTRFKEKLAEAQNAPQARERSFWSTLFSSNWFEALIYGGSRPCSPRPRCSSTTRRTSTNPRCCSRGSTATRWPRPHS